jgi:C4-dicarboxylate transporter DctM subunit
MNSMIHGPQWALSWQVVMTWLDCHVRAALPALHRLEDVLLAASIVILVLLGLAGATRGLVGADELLRHMTLVLGMLGGMTAAREGRLLAIGSLAQALPERARPAVKLFTGQVSTAVAALLTAAAWQFVALEAEVSDTLAFGVPRIALQVVLPLGFAVLTLRLAHRSHARLPVQAAVLAAAVAAALAVTQLDADVAALRIPLLAVLGAAMLLGAPIFVGLAGVALIFFLTAGDPVSSVALDHYDQVTNPLLATLPLFTLAGFVVASGGAGRRLVRVLGAWTGHLRGGPAIMTVLACAFFTAFTGGSGITILALGGLLMPVLVSSKYSDKSALGLVTGAGSLGVLFAPCLPLILYSVIAGVPIGDMFLGAALPGLLLVVLACAWGIIVSPPLSTRRRFSWRRAWVSTWRAKWELLLPAVPLTLIFGGYALPVPAAAATAAYALLVAAFVNRDLPRGWQLVGMIRECGLLVGGVLLILGAAMGLTNLLVMEHVPDRMAAWLGSAIESRWVLLLSLNACLLLVGCVMDVFSAIIVVAPLVVPVALAFGIDPVHLGVIFLANLELGYLTPPVGLNLFMSATRFERPVMQVARASVPMLLVMAIGVALITAFPEISLALVRLFGEGSA